MKHQKNVGVLSFLLFSLILSPPSLGNAQGLNPGDSLVVLDRNQNLVGKVVDGLSQTTAIMVFEQNPFLYKLELRNNDFNSDFRGQTYFESDDCSGSPVLDSFEPFNVPFAEMFLSPSTVVSDIVVNQDNLGIVYVADPNDQPHMVLVESFLGNPTGCNPNISEQKLVVNTIQVLDLDALFTAPFHFEVVRMPDLAGIQDQIDDQNNNLNAHTHDYLTGSGMGQNKFSVETSSPNIP